MYIYLYIYIYIYCGRRAWAGPAAPRRPAAWRPAAAPRSSPGGSWAAAGGRAPLPGEAQWSRINKKQIKPKVSKIGAWLQFWRPF